MLNPDGVIVGNYRCSLAGRDLNRNYTSLLKESFPSVWYTRNMIHRLMEKREVILYCDLHGHSRKENIFMYGCDGSDKSKGLYLQQRIFPLMLSKNCPNKFSFSACKFNVQKSKEGTGRVVMWKMGIRNSFTMEATFCGSTLGNKRGTHFNTKDLESMGYHFCDSLLDYCDPDRTKYYQCLKELEEMQKRINLEKVFDDSDNSLIEITFDLESSRGSDSSDSDSQTYLLKLTSQIKAKTKYLKTEKERNSTTISNQNATEEQEAYGRGHLLQRLKESYSDVKDSRSDVPDDFIVDYFRRQLPNQGLDMPHNLKSKMKECTSFQSKKTGINWTDDEKRIYRDKRIAQAHILQYLFPVMQNPKNMKTPPIKQLFNPRTNFQIQHQLKAASCITIKRSSTSWTPPINPPFIAQRNLEVTSSECFQSMSQRSFEKVSPLKSPKKRKKHSRIWAAKTEGMQPLSSKWETAPSSFEVNEDIREEKAEDSSQQSSKHITPHLTKNKGEQPNKNE
ncbi:cytosolic carboxypeptidase 3 isoform X2 [Tupaia chinensis]|uniref:cytosolic carboxypeptidase 3 isoform X2 n=1 Tax=Tupaia chinensis TaxID=246437 RepID=UPI000FFBC813|nr:cytosolic carboxypeptidase 3 isoform X2 [Tupaia chinensis]